jgi:hypothetical protein
VKKLHILAVAASAFAITGSAHATTLLYNLSGSRTATFQLDSAARPDAFNNVLNIFSQATYNNVAGTFGGVAETATIVFGTDGFQILAQGLGFSQFISDSPTFSGTSLDTVMLLPGTFNLRSIVSGSSVLTATPLAGAVPETAAWAMMIAGFAMSGGAFRIRRRQAHIALV